LSVYVSYKLYTRKCESQAKKISQGEFSIAA